MRKRSGKRLLAALLFGSLTLAIAEEPAKSKAASDAVIIGTVFRETGHAFPGVEVALVADPQGPVTGKKPKPQKLASSGRGEVVFRVPPVPMRYTLTVKAKGYKAQSKTVDIQADERQDVNFLLEVEKQ